MSSMIKCAKCGAGLMDGITLYRCSPKGTAARWACREHRDELGWPKDPDLDHLIDSIEQKET